jgi:hypothetical protein
MTHAPIFEKNSVAPFGAAIGASARDSRHAGDLTPQRGGDWGVT